ncbi:MAG TPA: allantoinase AllB [Chthoniobacterales bacterium]|nr:allantoinase AllB [Chthoniobacterales bacterium]
MPDFDLLIRHTERDVGIAEGKIAELGPNIRGNATEEIDATRLTVFPGAIDSHLHFNEPGRTEWEGWATGSSACAVGGTTTVFEMPLNAHPPTIDGPAFDAKRAAAERNSFVDFGLWGGLIPGNIRHLKTLRDRGVVGLKAFMCNSGIDDFPYVDSNTLREGMATAAKLGLLVAVHAESQEITERLTKQKLAGGNVTVRDFLESRPIEAELDAIGRATEIAADTGCRLHVVHVSCGRGVELVAAARAQGIDVTCETCPHYLILTEDDMEKIGAAAKCAPPLRSAADQSDLHNALAQITSIGSDHSPSPPEMKRSENFFEVWGGISGCQHLLALLIDRKLPVDTISALTSINVAERFGLSGKGGIAVGRDADLTLIDLNNRDPVTTDSLQYRHKLTPYLGRKLPRVIRTILRGQTIAADGKLVGQPAGRIVRPARA